MTLFKRRSFILCPRIGLILLCSYIVLGCSAYHESVSSNECYRPLLGAVMLGVDAHHRKLGEAGLAKEWDFALYELEELEETFHQVSQYEYENLPAPVGAMSSAMVYPAIEAVETALQKKDLSVFKSSYRNLTNSCNGCHTAVGVGFIKVKHPVGF